MHYFGLFLEPVVFLAFFLDELLVEDFNSPSTRVQYMILAA